MATRLDRPVDRGFTLVETIVALALISVLMASLGTYFVGTMKVSRYQAQIQVATRLLQTGMEQARGYGGPALLIGRAQCGSCMAVGPSEAKYLSSMTRFDAAVGGTTPTLALPQNPAVTAVNGITFYRYTFVGRCWRASVTDSACGTTSTLPIAMIRLVLGVTWTGTNCPGSSCIRVSTALFSANPSDPVFTQ